MGRDWKSEIMRDFATWLVDLPSDGEPPVAPATRRGLSDLFSAVSKLGSEVALQNRASKQAVVGLEATNAELSRIGTSLGGQRKALQALISESGPARLSRRDLAVGFLEIRDSLARSYEMVAEAEAALKAGSPREGRVQPLPQADEQPPTEARDRDDLHDRPPEDGTDPAEAQTQGDVEGKPREAASVPAEPPVQAGIPVELREERPAPAEPQSHDGFQRASREDRTDPAEVQTQGQVACRSREDDPVSAEPQAPADVPAGFREEGPAPAEPESRDGSGRASQEVGAAAAERPGPETEEIAQHREIVANIAGTLAVVLRKFDTILMSQGIAAIETVGRPFDPALMSVVGTREVPGVPSWIVVDEVRGGFLMGRRVLRSAEVFVNRRGGE